MLIGDFDYMASMLLPDVKWLSKENHPVIGTGKPLVCLQVLLDNPLFAEALSMFAVWSVRA